MKLAIIGGGISGNMLAHLLHRDFDITMFEKNDYLGGHTHTHQIFENGKHLAIDTGFIVFNYRTYPQFTRLLNELKVEVQKSDMSFGVKNEIDGLEYNGANLNGLLAQRSNLLRPPFYRMVFDILRFNKQAPIWLKQTSDDLTLSEYLYQNRYSKEFVENYVIPMGSAIWSSNFAQMMDFPARFFIRFFHNHGLLSVTDQPDWYVIKGGSAQYLKALSKSFKQKIKLNHGVKKVIRKENQNTVISEDGQSQDFDYVFFACHADQALQMLDKPDPLEQSILGAFPYQKNIATLHTDTSVLPQMKRAWAAWNYHRHNDNKQNAMLTYNMNILQGLECKKTYCVTLNHKAQIDPHKVIKQIEYHHPVFTPEGIKAQGRHQQLNGKQRCFYAGAYWANGFHEDGVVSAINSVNDFNEVAQHEQQTLRRAG